MILACQNQADPECPEALKCHFMGRNWLHMQSHQYTELLNQLSEIRASESKIGTHYGQNSPFLCPYVTWKYCHLPWRHERHSARSLFFCLPAVMAISTRTVRNTVPKHLPCIESEGRHWCPESSGTSNVVLDL